MTADTGRWRIRRAAWDDPTDRERLRLIRREVFIVEQQVPEALEWDEDDASAIHLLAETSDGGPVGTARILPSGQIGRMAVRRAWREQGIGSALLTTAIDLCPRPPFLHAQVQAMAFYATAGFSPVGEAFLEAGILHRVMRLSV